MGTRAIIGYMNTDGSIIGGWQRYNGDNLAPFLRKHFDNIDKVQKLVKYGVWNYIVSTKNIGGVKELAAIKNESYIPVENCVLVQEKGQKMWTFSADKNVFQCDKGIYFPNIITAYGQDISFLYLFNPQTGKWRTFGFTRHAKVVEKVKNMSPTDVIYNLDYL